MYFSDNFISVLIIVEFNILSDIFSDRIISEVSWVISSVDLSVSTFSEYVFSMNGPFVISDSVRNLFEYVFSELFSFVVSVSVSENIVWDMSWIDEVNSSFDVSDCTNSEFVGVVKP